MSNEARGKKGLPLIKTERTFLRLPEVGDIDRIINFFESNRQRFESFAPPRPDGFFTESYWKRQVTQAVNNFHEEKEMNLLLFEDSNSNSLLGRVNFSQMVRGPFQACNLGYSISEHGEGRGLMAEALMAATGYVFNDLNYHRIMANHLPENLRSAKLLKRIGFSVEGIALKYLYINGDWRDHVLNSLTNEQWKNNFK